MKSLLVAAVLLLVSTQLHGEPQPWMKSNEPETLRYGVEADSECPISTAALDELVTGVLIRSRIKPQLFFDVEKLEKASREEKVKYLQQEDFGFGVNLDCVRMNNQHLYFIYELDIHFLRYLPKPGRTFYEVQPYGGFGVGNEAELKAMVKERVEALVTDYLQANFDLAPE